MIWPFNRCDHEWEDGEVSIIDNYRSPRVEDGKPYLVQVTVMFEQCEKCNRRRNTEKRAEKMFISVDRVEELATTEQ